MFATMYVLLAQASTDIFGTVEAPPGVKQYGSLESGGLLNFVSNIVKLIVLIGGLFGLINIIGAGYTYLGSAGNPKATEQAMQQLANSLIGLIIIVGSFGITAIASYLLFGDAMYILKPSIPSIVPGGTP